MSQAKSSGTKIAVLGFGAQGRAIALNLRDFGYQVIVGLRPRSKNRRKAKRDGIIDIRTIEKAVAGAVWIVMALPDHEHGRIFEKEIRPHLAKGATLVFLHGLSVHFGLVKPPKDGDVVLLAPHAPGLAVREKYLTDRSISAFYAVHQNYTGKALKTVYELAQAIGIKRQKLIKTSFRNEAIGDLFGEQAVLCGGLAELVLSGFRTLVKNGVPSENAYLEVAYQLDLIIGLIKKYGIAGMYQRISVAARYGSLTAGRKVIGSASRKQMQTIYNEVASGRFAKRLNGLSSKDISQLEKLLKQTTDPAFERAVRKFSK